MLREPMIFDDISIKKKKKFIVKSYSLNDENSNKVYKFEKFENTHYVWYECRGWTYLWGLNISSEDLTNKMIDKFNKDGWKINTFYRHGGYFPNLPIILTFMIMFSSIVSFGFITYFWGHYIIVEKDFSSYKEGEEEKTKLMNSFKKERREMYKHSLLMFFSFLFVFISLIVFLKSLNWSALLLYVFS